MRSRSVFLHRIFLCITLLALISQACALTLLKWPFPSTPGAPSSQPPTGPSPTPQARAEVKFTVRLPAPLAANEVLAISVVDEVTGIALNAVDYQLTAVDTITYSTTLTIPDHAIIKYRYIRRGASRVAEDTNNDAPIRYRMVYVNGPTPLTVTPNV